MTAGALAGLRVLEIGGFEAAAYCGKMFADFGAEVIKVEPPGGDPARLIPPWVDAGDGQNESALFAWLNTNKQSVTIDPAADGAGLLRSLALASHVVIDGRAGETAAAWRKAIVADKPDLTMVALSWFGESGPYRDFVATDATVRALAGLVWVLGEPGTPPEPISDHQASVVAGLGAFTAALAARLAPDPGRRFEVSALEANLPLADLYIARVRNLGYREQRYGRNRFGAGFPMGMYPCREGWIGLTAVTFDQWQGFCELLGLEVEAADPTLAVMPGRFARAEELEARFTPRLLEKTAAEWFELGRRHRLPWAIAPDMAELFSQAVHRERGAFAPVRIGEAVFEAPGLPQRVTKPRQPANGAAPLAGADTPCWRTEAERPAPAGVRRTSAPTARPRPLDGVRIVDLTMGWAGPLATRQLGDLGAEIIKVESCGYVDWWRSADPREEAVRAHQFEKSGNFNAVNRNKKGVTLDLTKPEGAQLLKRLVATADAVIENYSRDVLPKLDLDYARLREANPSLVMVSMPAFPSDSAWGDVRAYGSTLEHASGLPSIAGAPGSPPMMTHLALGDPIGGLSAAPALLIALHHRRETGEGQHVDLSQVQCLFPLAAPWAIEQAVAGHVTRTGGRHALHSPHGCFRCLGEDDWLLIAVTDDGEWKRLCEAIGRADLAADPELASSAGRRAHEAAIEAAISAWTSSRSPDAAMAALQQSGVPCGVARRPSELLDDPHLVARGACEWVERPWIGRHPQTLAAFREDGRPYPVIHPSPLLGEFNDAVLGEELGLSKSELEALGDRGVIGRTLARSTRTSVRAAT